MGNPPDTDPLLGSTGSLAWTRSYHAYNRNAASAAFVLRTIRRNADRLGVHLLDIVHWAMGVDAPKTVSTFGGKYVLNDNSEIPDTLEVVFDTRIPVSAKFIVTWSNRTNTVGGRPQLWHRVLRHRGTLFLDRDGYTLAERNPSEARASCLRVIKSEGSASATARGELPDCVRSRRKPTPSRDHHRSTSART